MSSLEEVRAEIVELENQVALLMDEIKVYRSNTKDGVERRKRLYTMQMELGKHTRRLKYLKGII